MWGHMTYNLGLGGVRTVGKSTLARSLGGVLNADIVHFARARDMIRGCSAPEDLPDLFESVIAAPSLEDTIRILRTQATYMRRPVQTTVDRCRERGAGVILEGMHVLPGLYDGVFDFQVLLVASPRILASRNHESAKPDISEKVLQRNIELQEYLTNQARAYDIPIIDTTSIQNAQIQILKLIGL